jgi:hypothetical protein
MTSQKTNTVYLDELRPKLGNRGNRYTAAEIYNFMGKFKVAGHGDKTNDMCGTFKNIYKVRGKEKYIGSFMNCNKLECPICCAGASNKKAEKPALKLLLRSRYQNKPIRHWSLNFNLNLFHLLDVNDPKFTYQTFKKLRLRLSYLLRAIGIEYGYLVLHSHRLRDDDKLHVSPHFHLIGVGKLPQADLFYKTFGFTYKNHGVRKYGFNVRSTISYLLSHSAVYYGKPSYYYFQADKSKEHYSKICEEKMDPDGDTYHRIDNDSYVVRYPEKYQCDLDDAFFDDKKFCRKRIIFLYDPDDYLDPDPLLTQYLVGFYFNLRIHSKIFDVPETIMEYFKTKQYAIFDRMMKVWEKQFMSYFGENICHTL